MTPRPRRAVIDVQSGRGLRTHAAIVRRAARRAIAHLGVAPCELSIALVDDEAMRALNREWRGKDSPTDVLAFAQAEGDGPAIPELLGDVVISVPTACRQASRRAGSVDRELETLVVHGILHLLGYDHERSRGDARLMFALQREVLDVVSRPASTGPPAKGSRVRSRSRG